MIVHDPRYDVTDIAKELKEEFPGLLFGREVEYLYHTAERIGPGWYADLGTFQGLSGAAIARGILDENIDAQVTSVDTFQCTGVSKKYHPEDPSYWAVTARLSNYFKEDFPIRLYQLNFTAASLELDYLKYDFIFLDGSHDYDSVMRDFYNWFPLLKEDGEFAFHDATIRAKNKQVWKLMDQLPDLGWEQVAEERTIKTWRRK